MPLSLKTKALLLGFFFRIHQLPISRQQVGRLNFCGKCKPQMDLSWFQCFRIHSMRGWTITTLIGRGDWARTSDLIVPNDARYQTAPHPDWKVGGRKKSDLIYLEYPEKSNANLSTPLRWYHTVGVGGTRHRFSIAEVWGSSFAGLAN